MWNWLSNRVPGYQKIAERLKMAFYEKDDNKSLLQSHKPFKLFKIGSGRKIKYILIGQTCKSDRAYLFEYNYTVSTGKSSATYIQHVYSVELNKHIPSFVIKPQNALHSIGKWFGMQDIEFERYDQFNKNYLVKAENQVLLEKFMNRDFLGFLSYETGWSIESIGNKIIFYKASKRMNEEMVEPFYQAANTMFNVLMKYTTLEKMDSIPKFDKGKK